MESAWNLDRRKIWTALANTLPNKDLFHLLAEKAFPTEQWYLYSIVKQRKCQYKYALFLRKYVDQTIHEMISQKCIQGIDLSDKLIHYYFNATFKDQKRILQFMLHQTKNDRAWACAQLKERWIPEFEQEILELFDQSHNLNCAVLIMLHCSNEIIYQRHKELAKHVSRVWIMERLWNTSLETWSMDELYPSEKIRIIRRMKLTDNYGEIENILYKGIAAEVEYLLTLGEKDDKQHRLFSGCSPESNFAIDYWSILFFCRWIKGVDNDNVSDVPGNYLLSFFGVGLDINSSQISLLSFPMSVYILATMGQLGLYDAIIRFNTMDMKTTCRSGENRQETAVNIFNWLLELYRKINVQKFGYPELNERYTKLLPFGELVKQCGELKRINKMLPYNNFDSFSEILRLDYPQELNTYVNDVDDEFDLLRHYEDVPF